MKTSIITILILLAYLLVGTEDYKEEVKQVENYCEMVEAGYWPAYDESVDCGNTHKRIKPLA